MAISLNYWDGRGLIEPARLMLILSNKEVGIDFKDSRYGMDSTLPAHVEPYAIIARRLAHNLGRLPLLQVDNESIGQSVAINYYLASQLDFLGDTPLEAAHILEFQEHLKEMKAAYFQVCPYGSEPTQAQLDLWFNGGAEDQSPEPADMNSRDNRMMRWWCGRLEYLVGRNFVIGNRFSLADILLYCTFGDYLKENEAIDVPVYRRYPFGSKARTDNILKEFPKLSNICCNFANNEKVQSWLDSRGKQRF